MKNLHQILETEMSTLIKNSCAVHPQANSEYYSFQKALLKFFFGATDVIIDYEKEQITLLTLTQPGSHNRALHSEQTTVLVNICYMDLEQTLMDCLETGEKQARFYRSMLFHYNHVAEQVGVWSA